MPLAVTHILVPIILVDTFRDHILKKKNILSNRFILLAGLSGLLSDIDLPISYLLGANLHRTITHSVLFPLIFLTGFIFFYFYKKKTLYKIFLMLFVGFSTHIMLDYLFGEIYILFPLSMKGYYFNPSYLYDSSQILVMFDAVLLFFWLIHEQLEHKISDYF